MVWPQCQILVVMKNTRNFDCEGSADDQMQNAEWQLKIKQVKIARNFQLVSAGLLMMWFFKQSSLLVHTNDPAEEMIGWIIASAIVLPISLGAMILILVPPIITLIFGFGVTKGLTFRILITLLGILEFVCFGLAAVSYCIFQPKLFLLFTAIEIVLKFASFVFNSRLLKKVK